MIIIYRQKVQGYMKEKSVDNCPMAFRRRCEMVKEVKGNFKDKRGESRRDDCDGDHVQTQAHCLVCPRWDNIRQDLDLDKIGGMVNFFQRLLMERLTGTGS